MGFGIKKDLGRGIKMEWQSGTPKKPDWYVVAILYNNGLGIFGCANWDADHGWSLKDDNIIAYIPVIDLLRNSKVVWPEHLMPEHKE
ncbi:hypothetical protein [Hahella chejuensis]|nr:hypothetical protein [Hahella chejuensis]